MLTISANILGSQTIEKPQVRNTNHKPAYQSSHSRDVDKPAHHIRSRRSLTHYQWRTHQPNTTLLLVPNAKYTRGKKIQLQPTAAYGTPNRFVRLKKFGAWDSSARPRSVREAKKMQELPVLNALVPLNRWCQHHARWNVILRATYRLQR